MAVRLKIRGKLILSFSAVMVLVLSGLGYITYITFADAILAHKQQIASLRLENIRLRVAENSDPTGHLGQAELLQSLQSKDSFGESFVLLSQGEQLLLDSSNQALTEHQQLLGDLLAAAVTDELVKVGDVYAIHDSLPRSQLDLWYLIPESEFLASLIELKNRVVVATIIILWASIWVVLIIAHKISGPIRHLSRATEAMQKTEYSKPLKFAKTGDEISDLGQRFEDMRSHIEGLIFKDPLSNLFNRRYLMHALETEIGKSIRKQHALCCLMMDLDHFKQVNDTFGHQCGDEVIRQAAITVQGMLRNYDICARYGGEEFIVILPETEVEAATLVAERIRQAVEQLQIEWEGELYSPTMSVGVSQLDVTPDDPGLMMINAADEALYLAKRGGRNQVVVADEATPKALLDAANS